MTMPSKADTPSHMWIKDITEKDRIQGSYLVKEKRMGTTRNGKPFISMTLADRTGDVEAKVWNRAQELSALFEQGHILDVEGDAESFRGRIQINISGLKVSTRQADPGLFLESAPGDATKEMTTLREILRGVKNDHLKALIQGFLEDKAFLTQFKKAPAAKRFHHSYVGGLLEHTLSLCKMAAQVAGHYPELDRDLLVTAAFLHDIGKTRELKADLQIDYTDEGRLLGHVVLGAAMVDEKLYHLKDFPQELALRLKHLILSHHGEYEFGSPKRPKFLEAFALHLIDDLDAKMNGISRFMQKDRREGDWTEFNRMFERYFIKKEITAPKAAPDEGLRVEERQGTLFATKMSD
ncbi:MAG: CRISPR-associated endonuclease Cas3'' [Deltaproteobacteria bacterium]|nr:CRISPR-associated endonuclease Cas3'' [Deltaproteobacteria bacterium]